MKRYNNLYKDICKFENIVQVYNEIRRNIKNKKRKALLSDYKAIYISRVYNTLNSKSYVVGKYNVFKLYEPKERIIYSQNIEDKIINQLVAKYSNCHSLYGIFF